MIVVLWKWRKVKYNNANKLTIGCLRSRTKTIAIHLPKRYTTTMEEGERWRDISIDLGICFLINFNKIKCNKFEIYKCKCLINPRTKFSVPNLMNTPHCLLSAPPAYGTPTPSYTQKWATHNMLYRLFRLKLPHSPIHQCALFYPLCSTFLTAI